MPIQNLTMKKTSRTFANRKNIVHVSQSRLNFRATGIKDRHRRAAIQIGGHRRQWIEVKRISTAGRRRQLVGVGRDTAGAVVIVARCFQIEAQFTRGGVFEQI